MRKRDLELLKNIKKQEQQKRAEDVVQQIQEEKDSRAISFDAWWIEFSKEKGIRHHIKEILKVDFKARGLKDMEKKEDFDKAATIFGYK